MTDRVFEDAVTWRETDEIRVLHVDAEPGFAEMTTEQLEGTGSFAVDSETDPQEALDRLENGTVDCVVSDSQFAGMDGLELLARVRERSPDLPFVLFAREGSEEIASDAISAGVTDYVRKESTPEQFDLLANRIEHAVERYRMGLAHERLREALDAVPDGFAILDADAEIVYTNRRCAILYGCEPQGLRGRDLADLYPVDEAIRIREEILPALEDVGAWEGRTRGLRTDGSTYPQFLSLTRMASGEFACVVRDITERVNREQELEWERSRADALFENLSEPTAYAEFEDGDPVVREINPAFEEVFGVTESEARGRTLDELIVPETHSTEGQEINDRVRDGEVVDTVVERETADGLRRFNLLSVPLAPGESGDRGFGIYRRLSG